VIHLPTREMRVADLPFFSRAIRCQDERALLRADQQSYFAHGLLLLLRTGKLNQEQYATATSTLCLCVYETGFFEEIGAMSPQRPQDGPRVMEIVKKFGLEILPPPDA
jgi:hypothetical protein